MITLAALLRPTLSTRPKYGKDGKLRVFGVGEDEEVGYEDFGILAQWA